MAFLQHGVPTRVTLRNKAQTGGTGNRLYSLDFNSLGVVRSVGSSFLGTLNDPRGIDMYGSRGDASISSLPYPGLGLRESPQRVMSDLLRDGTVYDISHDATSGKLYILGELIASAGVRTVISFTEDTDTHALTYESTIVLTGSESFRFLAVDNDIIYVIPVQSTEVKAFDLHGAADLTKGYTLASPSATVETLWHQGWDALVAFDITYGLEMVGLRPGHINSQSSQVSEFVGMPTGEGVVEVRKRVDDAYVNTRPDMRWEVGTIDNFPYPYYYINNWAVRGNLRMAVALDTSSTRRGEVVDDVRIVLVDIGAQGEEGVRRVFRPFAISTSPVIPEQIGIYTYSRTPVVTQANRLSGFQPLLAFCLGDFAGSFQAQARITRIGISYLAEEITYDMDFEITARVLGGVSFETILNDVPEELLTNGLEVEFEHEGLIYEMTSMAQNKKSRGFTATFLLQTS